MCSCNLIARKGFRSERLGGPAICGDTIGKHVGSVHCYLIARYVEVCVCFGVCSCMNA